MTNDIVNGIISVEKSAEIVVKNHGLNADSCERGRHFVFLISIKVLRITTLLFIM